MFYRVEWHSDGRMYLDLAPAAGASNTIWMRQAQGGAWEPLQHINQACNHPGLQRLVGDPQLLGISCITGVINSRVQYGAFVYDLNQRTIRPLFPNYQPPEGGYLWNTEHQQGIVGTGGSFGTYYWLTPQGSQPLTLTLQNNTAMWTMSDSVQAVKRYETSHADFERYSKAHPVGIAGDMDWNPAIHKLAFWATLAPIGKPYSVLDRIPWDLYVVDTDTWAAQKLLTSGGDAGEVRWSKDGQWLAYTTPGNGWQHSAGLYLWSVQAGQMYRVHAGLYSSIAWSPDQMKIVATTGKNELWLYDVASILNRAIE
jgi:hypothetical protein